MISDDTIISEKNVSYIANKGREITSEVSDEPANLATVARLFNFEKKSLYLDKPLSIARFKYFYDKNLASQNPYGGYTQLEYIEADGNQWIDTGFKPNQDTSIEFHCDVHSDTEAVAPLFGSRTSINGSQAFVLWLYNGNYRFDYQVQKYNLTGVTNTGRRYIFAGGYDNTFTIDQKTWSLGNYTFSVPNNLYIFGMMENDGIDDRHPSGKIYLCNIFSSPGTAGMERRFIPAKRNSDGVSGLLDILDCTFYESLGEPWIAGPEIGPMPNFALNGYDIMEYARSSTETYVDTEFTPDQDSRVTMEMQKTANTTSTAQYIFCSRYSATPEYGIIKAANDYRWRDGYAKERILLANSETGASITQRMIIDKNKNVTYIGHGTINHTYTNFTTPNTMALYGCFENGKENIDYSIDMDLYWCRIYDNGILVRNYYPARRQSDNAIGLYDFVNGKFTTPIKGTLSCKYTIPVNKAANLEYLESTGTQWIDTGLYTDPHYRITMRCSPLTIANTNPGAMFFGSTGTQGHEFYIWTNNVNGQPNAKFGNANYNSYGPTGINVGDVIDVDFNENWIRVAKDGSNIWEYMFPLNSFTSDRTLRLFSLNRPGSSNYTGLVRIYYVKIYRSDVLVKDLKPVLKDGVACMYDSINKEYLYNGGTGSFIAGPEL